MMRLISIHFDMRYLHNLQKKTISCDAQEELLFAVGTFIAVKL